ncbi:MAG TPA: alpha/beta hydrolase [Candidatus Sulfotelmatobacter sp.]|jgi:pimeloyl-ACP methyl ester carboxylesterase|nr:alpha/beta hydrolase [Candidatus Sulfotelmatobacter sp.]
MRTAAIALSLVAAWSAAAAQTPELVDVGGYRLDVVRAGAGSPALVLVGGLGNSLDTWSPIVPAAAELTSVVAYSRAGLGRSEAGPASVTAKSAVEELHRLLAALQVKPPYVLVGASYGGILVRLYTSLYPAEVAGLVLVDASSEQQVQRWGKLDKTYPAAFKSFFEERLKSLTGAEAAETRESMRIQAAGAVEGMKPVPDIPLAVLTSMKVDPTATTVNGTREGHEAWRAMHEEWLRSSHNAVHFVTTRSGHHIHEEEPLLVLEAIRFVVDRVRTQ